MDEALLAQPGGLRPLLGDQAHALKALQRSHASPPHAEAIPALRSVGPRMPAQTLVERLEAVRENGPGKWLARCPAHADGRPSLSIRDVDGERTLVHCFAGCTADEVLAAAGLDWSALFADRPQDWPGKKFQRMQAPRYERETLKHFGNELGVAFIIMRDVAEGKAVDLDRLARARKVLLELWAAFT